MNGDMRTLKNWAEVPKFENREEEKAFWQETTIDLRLLDNSLTNPEFKESTSITLRLDPRMLSRLKRLARQRFLNYQSMMKQWLSERLEKEIAEQPNHTEDDEEQE